MQVSVNIGRIREHISLLRNQQKEAEALINCLFSLRKQAAETGIPDIGSVDWHLKVSQNQAANIRRRITLLESISEDLIDLTQSLNRNLTDAQGLARTMDL